MGKTIGKLMGAGGASTKMHGSENDILNYLKNYDTSAVDGANRNMAGFGNQMSQNLGNMGNYNFSVDGSDDARKRAEQAMYQSYVDKTAPQYGRMRSDLETRLANQGLGVGSEAYQRSINDFDERQMDATNQAAYSSVLNGQNAFSQSMGDQMNAGSFGNNAQQSYINQIASLLQGSMSGYDKNMDIYGIQSGADNRIANNKAANSAAQSQAGNNALSSLLQGAALFSDRRLKENILPVGHLDNGLTVYCFNYKGQNTPQIGLIAQEVQKIKPNAVFKDESGYLKVNYKIATEA